MRLLILSKTPMTKILQNKKCSTASVVCILSLNFYVKCIQRAFCYKDFIIKPELPLRTFKKISQTFPVTKIGVT